MSSLNSETWPRGYNLLRLKLQVITDYNIYIKDRHATLPLNLAIQPYILCLNSQDLGLAPGSAQLDSQDRFSWGLSSQQF